MACPAALTSSSSSCCCRASSHSHVLSRRPLRLLAASRPARISLSYRRLSPSRSRIPASPDPDVAGDNDDDNHKEEEEEYDERIGFQIQVSKMGGKRNRRLVRARVRVDAPLEAVWATLTGYEGLADFIPGLSECRLLDQATGYARLYQVGQQDLALGFKFNAKGTIDCYEGDMVVVEDSPEPRRRRRDIAFNMIDGDFKLFQGKWSVEEVDAQGGLEATSEEQEQFQFQFQFQTTLSYLVELEPKLWVPVRLLEGRICTEIKNNLVSIREQAQRIHLLRLEQEQK